MSEGVKFSALEAESAESPAEGVESGDELAEEFKRIKRILRNLINTIAAVSAIAVSKPYVAEAVFDIQNKERIESVNELREAVDALREIYGDYVYDLHTGWTEEAQSFWGDRDMSLKKWPFAKKIADKKGEVNYKSSDILPPDSVSRLRSSESEISNNEILRNIISDIPSHWMHNVSSIRQINEDYQRPGNDAYGLNNEEWVTVATAKKVDGGKTAITLYSSTHDHTVDSNRKTIIHEIAHANDWNRATNLSHLEKARLLLRITERLDAEDRYMSAYVESIENEDEQTEKFLKAVEYWAEISAVFFTNPEALNIYDYELVASSVKKNDNQN